MRQMLQKSIFIVFGIVISLICSLVYMERIIKFFYSLPALKYFAAIITLLNSDIYLWKKTGSRQPVPNLECIY